MKRTFREALWRSAVFLALGLMGIFSWATPQERPGTPTTPLKVGDPAPDFTLPDQNNRPVRLADFKGKKNVVLAFYVLAFTGG